MMMAGFRVGKWRPIVGVLGLGLVVALVATVELEGAPVGSRKTAARNKAIAKKTVRYTETSARTTKTTTSKQTQVRFGQLPGGGFKTIYAGSVDYRDDEGTRLRAAGLLKGPLPFLFDSAVATAGACTFDIQCDDGDPCTIDNCNFPPGAAPGSGKCENTVAQDGSDGAHGDDDCEAGLLCGGCDDGLACNGLETCQGGSCVAPGSAGPATCCGDPDPEGPGERICSDDLPRCNDDSANAGDACETDGDCPAADPSKDGECDICQRVCAGDGDCDDGKKCNGDETCDT
ncbi:MAG: hypothetical protein IIB59_01525, partial [Planctomycetes bacterium]|nr:hypothetical protein [Planctomycetota bacterium]